MIDFIALSLAMAITSPPVPLPPSKRHLEGRIYDYACTVAWFGEGETRPLTLRASVIERTDDWNFSVAVEPRRWSTPVGQPEILKANFSAYEGLYLKTALPNGATAVFDFDEKAGSRTRMEIRTSSEGVVAVGLCEVKFEENAT